MITQNDINEGYNEAGGADQFHLIVFNESQFQIHFYLHYGVGISVAWKGKPRNIAFAYDYNGNSFRLFREEGGILKVEKNTIELDELLQK